MSDTKLYTTEELRKMSLSYRIKLMEGMIKASAELILNIRTGKEKQNHLRQAWKKPDVKLLRARMLAWRKSEAVVKVDKPLRLDRARNLGYKAKKGFVVARVRVLRGGRTKMRPKHGRRSKRNRSRQSRYR